MRKLQEFACHDFFKPMNFGNAITTLINRADLHDGYTRLKILNLLANNFVNFVRSNWFLISSGISREFFASRLS